MPDYGASLYYKFSCEKLDISEIYKGLNIKLFEKSQLIDFKDEILNVPRQVAAIENVYRNPINYMYIRIYNKGKAVGSIKTCKIQEYSFEADIDDLFKKIYGLLDESLNKTYGYE